MSNVAPDISSAVLPHFAEAASFVLSQIAGTALETKTSAVQQPIAAAMLIHVEISGALTGLCEIALSANMSVQFAALLTGETPAPAPEISSDTREAAAELVQQICGNAADRLRRAFGPLELKTSKSPERAATGKTRQLFTISKANAAFEFEFHIVRLSVPAKAEANTVPNSTDRDARLAPQTSPVSNQLPGATSSNLDLLLDIELGASLRFGTRQMLLKDIIGLCSGSVVELDRRVEEPVELLIDGRVIAHGDVVIVQGNYGLRIQQVATPGEKIACLR